MSQRWFKSDAEVMMLLVSRKARKPEAQAVQARIAKHYAWRVQVADWIAELADFTVAE